MLEVNDNNFEDVVMKSTKPVMLDFWAEWCGPCRMIGPLVHEMADEYGDKAVIAKVNVDDSPGVSQKFSIRNIPTILYIKNGQVVDKQVGAVAKTVLKSKLDAIL